MSRIEDEMQGQNPAPDSLDRGSDDTPAEPRLLTRHTPPETRNGRLDLHPSEPAEKSENGLSAWAARLARRRKQRLKILSILRDRRLLGILRIPRRSRSHSFNRQARRALPEKADQPARRRTGGWWALRLFPLALVLLVLAALFMALDLRHALRAALPQLDGELPVAGLHHPVTVTRNAQGVPAITAADLDDLLFAQGYVTASDRLWQMDGLRRHAAGELAEILGPGLVEHDRRQRYLQVRAAADRAIAALPADQLAQLAAYARGVNAFIDSHHGQLPMEFHLLAYKPAPWTPRDSLLVSLAIYQDMSTGFPGKMNREALATNLPGPLLSDLYPVGSWRDLPPAAQARNVTLPHEVEQIPLDPSQSKLASPPTAGPRFSPGTGARDLLAVSTGMAGAGRCAGCRSGSNNWAVSGAHTASGGAMVSNDMHLSLSLPDIWYEASLHTAPVASAGDPNTAVPNTAVPSADAGNNSPLNVVGFTLPGVPFVIVGRNAHLAWGLTNLGADVQDLRVEHLRGTGTATQYERPDGLWAAVHHREERIAVRGGRDQILDVLTTDHALGDKIMETPIVSPLYPSETRALSLAWTAYDPATVHLALPLDQHRR